MGENPKGPGRTQWFQCILGGGTLYGNDDIGAGSEKTGAAVGLYSENTPALTARLEGRLPRERRR